MFCEKGGADRKNTSAVVKERGAFPSRGTNSLRRYDNMREKDKQNTSNCNPSYKQQT